MPKRGRRAKSAAKRIRRQGGKPESWATRRDAATELGVIMNQPAMTEETLKSWLNDPACPLPRGRGPIPKVPLLVWIISGKRGPGRPADPANDRIKNAQGTIAEAKAATLLGQMVRKDHARDAFTLAAEAVRHDLVEALPEAVGEMFGTKSKEEAIEDVRASVTATLNRFAKTWGSS